MQSSINQAPRLARRSSHSFECWNIGQFTSWLEANGFHQIPRSRSIVEHSRWERSGRIVIVYQSGAIVVQGIQPEPAIKLLESLIEQPLLETAVC